MLFQKILALFLVVPLLYSCTKVSYLIEQGTGQIALQYRSKDNQDVLKDVKISKAHKQKIREIGNYKKWFYAYWGRKSTPIYDRTTFLKNEAVSYLVIASPFHKIEAREECFPIMGCFPYLGFFELESAKAFQKDLEEADYVTYLRPVYAYSTLGYFDDTILSSFFYYEPFDLAEIIFHELFHTIFFAKNEVDLNENLANYFGQELTFIYFKNDSEERERRLKEKDAFENLNLFIVKKARELNQKYETAGKLDKTKASTILESFLADIFVPGVKNTCKELSITPKDCFPLRRKWNNASFAAFMTYEKEGQKLRQLREKLGLDLKGFFHYIEKQYELFKGQDKVSSFAKFLLP